MFTIEQIFNRIPNYKAVCDLYLALAQAEETKEGLKEILYNGSYGDFVFDSGLSNKNNPMVEGQRRLSMAYLFVKNPSTFNTLADNKINLFHGTNFAALPAILEYGLGSIDASEKRGIDVQTGEGWSRINGKRSFVSLTDVLGIAEGYSTLKGNVSDIETFEVILGFCAEDISKTKRSIISSDIPEVAVEDGVPLEYIKSICVPEEKVELVQNMIGNKDILVCTIDDIDDKFYYFDDLGTIYVIEDKYLELKRNLDESSYDDETIKSGV